MAENIDSETLKSVTSNLKKDLECPICLDVVKHPFKLCARGHLMCVGCLKTLTACPTCQGKLLLESPVCIKNLLEHLPYECRNSASGCKKIVQNGDSHEKFCGFRPIKCRHFSCEQEILAKELLNHYKTIHAAAFVIKTESVDTGLIFSNFDPVKKRLSNNFVHLFGNFFWFILNNSDDEKQLKIKLEAIPIGKLEGDYYAKVSFINGNFNVSYTLKAFISEENEQSGQEANDGSNRINEFCMIVPQEMLPHFINKDKALKISNIFFFKG